MTICYRIFPCWPLLHSFAPTFLNLCNLRNLRIFTSSESGLKAAPLRLTAVSRLLVHPLRFRCGCPRNQLQIHRLQFLDLRF
jgi:hypothetical protein